MKIGIITENFVNLSGANDFLKQIIVSLEAVAHQQTLTLYLLLEDTETNTEKGIKAWINHYQKVRDLKLSFQEFKLCKKIIYKQENIVKVIQKYNLDIIFPYMKFNDLHTPTIGYLYDCQHRYLPEFFDAETRKARDSFFQCMINNYKTIIVNSKAVQKDLINFFNATSEQIFVLPYTPKIDLRFYKDYSSKIKKYKLPARYFMMSNQFWVHKDHPTALRAFAEYLKTDSDMEFIFTGAMEDSRCPNYVNELKQLLKDLKIENKVRFLGLIPKEEQLQIMKDAKAVIQTTLFEGGPGGGSVWDAISLGVPVILSDIITNQEVSYSRAHFFRVQDEHDLCKKMKDIVSKHYSKIPTPDLIKQSKKNMHILGNSLVQLFNQMIDSKKEQKNEHK